MSAIPAGMVECPDCEGEGFLEYGVGWIIRTVVCQTCGGWGYVDPADLPQPEIEESEEG